MISNIISQHEAKTLLDNNSATFIDGSWYLPAQNRNAKDEYEAGRIGNAVFFDIDAIADPNTDLPHMLPSPEAFAAAVGALGISSHDPLVVYDGPGLFSAPRVWLSLKAMGAGNVRILEGGMDGWKKTGLPVETGPAKPHHAAIFTPAFDPMSVIDETSLINELEKDNHIVLDARPYDRFIGKAEEPRPGLRSGHIPGSRSLPANTLVEKGKLLDKKSLELIFEELGIDKDTMVTTTCGSGVSAAIISLALDEIGRTQKRLFDGSWAQWGRRDGPTIQTGET